MNQLEQALSFVERRTQRTGYIADGPFGTYDHDGPRDERGRKQYVEGSVFYCVIWDDTGLEGDAYANDIDWIPATSRHITDGVRACWCNPSLVDGVWAHNEGVTLS
jgi:hypothetical protein